MLSVTSQTGISKVMHIFGTGHGIPQSKDGVQDVALLQVSVVLDKGKVTTQNLKGLISTSPSYILDGENDCYHNNISGALFSTAGLDSACVLSREDRAGSGFFYPPRLSLTQSGKVVRYTDLVHYGTPFRCSRAYAYYRSEQYPSVVCHLSCVVNWDGDNMDFGLTLYRGYGQTSYYQWTKWVFNPTQTKYNTYWGTAVEIPVAVTSDQVLSDYMEQTKMSRYGCISPINPVSGPDLIFSGLSQIDSAQVSRQVNLYYNQLPTIESPDWGKMSYEAISQMQTWDSNGIAYLKDLAGLKQTLAGLSTALKGVTNPKAAASVYLSMHYGLKLTVADSRSLIDSVVKQYAHEGPAKVSSSQSGGRLGHTWSYHYAIYFEPYCSVLNYLLLALDRFDLLPDLTNLWDLVPFSFVLDWFVDVGGLLDQFDASARLTRYNLFGSMRSEKWVDQVDPHVLHIPNVVGTLTYTRYRRSTAQNVEFPTYSVDFPINQGFSHWLEALALFVQKK